MSPQTRTPGRRIEAIVMGGSAGAVETLAEILASLPAGYRIPIAVVVHLPPNRPSVLAEVLGARCRIGVREAEDKEPIASGTVYFAPPGYHLLVEEGPAFALSVDEPVNFSIPSIDVLFESAAAVYGPRLAAAVLTGANEDGARGLRVVLDGGGLGIVQSPEHAPARAMPDAAVALCPEARVFEAGEIGGYLMELQTP